MSSLSRNSINIKIAVVCLFVATFSPIVWLIVQSFAGVWRFPALIPTVFDLRAWNYSYDNSSGVLSALFNSLFVAMLTTIIAITTALPAARAIALHDFKYKNLVLFVLLLPILSPSIVVAIGGHALFLRYGLTDSWLGVVLAHLIPTIPYCVLTLTGSFSRFDVDFESQARTLGASSVDVWRYVTLPAIAPGLMTSAVFAFLISWSQYLTTLLIGGGKIVTLPMLIIGFQRSSDEAVTAALTLIFLAPTILFLMLTTRFWREI